MANVCAFHFSSPSSIPADVEWINWGTAVSAFVTVVHTAAD